MWIACSRCGREIVPPETYLSNGICRRCVRAAIKTITIERREKMIRNEAYELSDELTKLGNVFTDETPNKEQADKILSAVFGIVNEGKDFVGVPKEERKWAIAHAFIRAGNEIFDKAIKYSDEIEVV